MCATKQTQLKKIMTAFKTRFPKPFSAANWVGEQIISLVYIIESGLVGHLNNSAMQLVLTICSGFNLHLDYL